MAGDNSVVVLDVSSDDDVGWGDGVAACGGGGGGVVGRDDGDWISEVLDEVDKEKDDSDEVVVVGEVIFRPKFRVSNTLVKCVTNVNNGGDDNDEDCVVLDGDPDKPLPAQNEKGADDDSEDLLVVSEKGQVACRDYPHARHLCVKFPFNSTPHERHCDQCHCYVCDSLAPCLYWSTSISTIDHCHATDKDEYWKSQRKSLKKTNDPLPMVSGVPSAPFSVSQSLPCQTSSLPSEYVQGYGTQNAMTYGMTPQPGYYSGDKTLPHWVSSQARSARNNFSRIRSDRRHNPVNAGSQVISRMPFRRKPLTAGVCPSNPYCSNTSRHGSGNQFLGRNPPVGKLPAGPIQQHGGGTSVLNTYKDSSKANFGGLATNLAPNLSTQTNIGNGTAYFSPSQPRIFTQPHGSSVNKNTVGPQHQVSSQIFVDSNYTLSIPTQPAVGTESNWNHSYDNSFPFQSQLTSYPEGAKISQVSMASEPLVTMLSNLAKTAQPNACTGSAAYQSQVCSLAASLLNNAGENVSIQANPTLSGVHASSTDFFQPQVCSLPAVQGNPIQSAVHSSSNNQALPVNQNAVQGDEPPVPLYGNSEFPACTSISQSDLQFDSWMFENYTSLDPLGNPELNMYSPEPTVSDAAFFDFSVL